jgi:hypothetical protein
MLARQQFKKFVDDTTAADALTARAQPSKNKS